LHSLFLLPQKKKQKGGIAPTLAVVSLPVFPAVVLTIFRCPAATSNLQKPPHPPRSHSMSVSPGADTGPTLRLRRRVLDTRHVQSSALTPYEISSRTFVKSDNIRMFIIS